MANNNNEDSINNPDNLKDSGLDKSFVEKFVSGIINSTPLSKWFSKPESTSKSFIQRRMEDEEYDVSYNFQPPTKRAKLPTDIDHNIYSRHMFESPVTVHASNNVNSSPKVLGKFLEPVPGSSSIKSQKLLEKCNTSSTNTTSTNSFEKQLERVNGEHELDSGESSSGYLSAPKLINNHKGLVSSNNKEACEKGTSKSRTLFTPTSDSSGRFTVFSSRSPPMNTSLSSKRPTFNASSFGSPNFVDRTLSTKRIMSSPFYSGNTVYGGASAYGRILSKNVEESNFTSRTSVQIKPVNERSTSENTTLSKTARRILNTLEQYSTPISDAKKIPVAPRKPSLLSTYIGATPYLLRDRKKPLNNELQVPSVPDLLQMKQKQRLQNSTEIVRQIAVKSNSNLNNEEYKLRTEEVCKQKYSNKMKSNVTSIRQKVQSIEPVNDVKLPKVSLPITTLPKFDFVLNPPHMTVCEVNIDRKKMNDISNTFEVPVPVSSKNHLTITQETENKIEIRKNSDYIFSEPLIISENLKPVTGINCFKFSEPLCKKQSKDGNVVFKSSEPIYKSDCFKLKNNGENKTFTATEKVANQLLTGSVMDTLGKKKETSLSQNSEKATKTGWKRPMSLVNDNLDKVKCSACNKAKSQSQLTKGDLKGFGDQPKFSSNKWECNSCMVHTTNKRETNKPDEEKQNHFSDKVEVSERTWECANCSTRNKSELQTCLTCAATKVVKSLASSNFGDRFKPSGDTWECVTCWIQNNKDLEKCAACETPRPGTKPTSTQKAMLIGNISTTKFNFGIKTDWECKVCLIKNKNDLMKCAACETLRESDEKKGFGDVFKMKNDEWECSSCMVRNKSTADLCVCCGITRPGSSSLKLSELGKSEEKKQVISFNFGIDKTSGTQFKFGIPTTKSKEKEKDTATNEQPPILSFVNAAKTASTTTSNFIFGLQSQEKASVVTLTGSCPSTVGNPLLTSTEKLAEKAVSAPVGFKFGLDTNLNKSQGNENSISFPSKEAVAVTSAVTSIPTLQFKLPATNGDMSKSKDDLSFSGHPTPKNSGTLGSDINKPNIFETNLSRTKEVMLSIGQSRIQEAPSDKKSDTTEISFGTVNKSVDPQFDVIAKTVESPFSTTNKLVDAPFAGMKKPVDSAFGGVSKSNDSPFGTNNKSIDSPFGKSNNLTESHFSNVYKSVSSPFGSVSSTTGSPFGHSNESSFRKANKSSLESPFGKVGQLPELPFAAVSKLSPSLFGNASENKPKEILFGTLNDSSKPQTTLFSGNNEMSKPQESFISDSSKPNEILFGSKPIETGNLFTNPTSTHAFTFAKKSVENNSTFSSATSSQSAVPEVFKFGPNASQNPIRKPFGDLPDNMSNGFGSSAKSTGFGAPQGFDAIEHKPFAFGSTESASKNSSFSFDQTDKPNPTAPAFNFGGPVSSTSSGGFNFSIPNTGFNFGCATKPFNSPSTNVFGSAGAAAKNGSFNFGTNTNNNNQKAVFSFGANQTAQPSQSSFPTQAAPGFNFVPPTLMTAPGGFNFQGAPPSFNYSDGSSAQTQTPRKIKKALRRTPR